MNYKLLSEEVQSHIETLYKASKKPVLVYHNLSHSKNVVAAVTQIANHYQLTEEDFFIVTTAAWFHDIGYLKEAKGHEEKGAEQAATFLSGRQISGAITEKVQKCILATKMPQSPHNLLEQIVCDADLFHLGTDNFSDNNKLMRKEYKTIHGEDISKERWRSKTIILLQNHHYHTDYCRFLLDLKKEENLQVLLAKQQKDDKKTPSASKAEKEPTTNEDTEKKKKDDRPDRGIETMFRVSSSNHQRLSDLADNKSHILITVNSIIISVVVSLLLRKLDNNNNFTIPAILLLLVSLVTIVLAIISTRPTIPNGTFTQADLDEKKVNLLFFGNFYQMSLESYTEGMKKVMNDSDFLYSSLIRDIYSQGIVLGKKYRLLRVAYSVFMFGLIVSVIGFIIASLI